MDNQKDLILQNIRASLGRSPDSMVAERPVILPPRQVGALDSEIELFVEELNKLSGVGKRLAEKEIGASLESLVQENEIKKAVLWPTQRLQQLKIAEQLKSLQVEIVSPLADKYTLAQCALGITEADFALPETGTLGLLSSAQKPRSISLLPRVHLAIVHPSVIRADLHQVFAESRAHDYLILITGPSRTADIELTVTLGVHGPKSIYAWVVA